MLSSVLRGRFDHDKDDDDDDDCVVVPGRCFVALYDYMAGDIDEVTFCEGDVIVNGEPIEGGWMIGTVLRNGQRGMLPANYVEAAA